MIDVFLKEEARKIYVGLKKGIFINKRIQTID